jgi:hypothetical protein
MRSPVAHGPCTGFGTGVARFALILVCALGPGCAGGSRHVRTYPAPTAEELVQAVRARQAALSGLNLEARATSWLGGERVRGTVQMLVARDGRLRFEAEVSLQGTVAALAVEHGQFTFIDHQKHLFRKGSACPANVASLMRIPLASAEVAAILLGDAPSLPTGARAVTAWDEARGVDVLQWSGPGGTTFWLGLRRVSPAVSAWQVVYLEGQDPSAQGRWRVSYEDFERSAGVELPRLVRFAEPGKSFDDGVEIRVRERIVNPTFAEHAFALEPPAGYAVEIAACGPAAPK